MSLGREINEMTASPATTGASFRQDLATDLSSNIMENRFGVIVRNHEGWVLKPAKVLEWEPDPSCASVRPAHTTLA